MPRTMSNKQKRAINAGRKRAGLKPIRFKSSVGIKEKRSKGKVLKNVWIKKSKNVKKGSAGNW